jgi:hypothetical protein
VTEVCGVCGGQLDHLAVRVTLTFAPGQHGRDAYRSVPWRLSDWPVCWSCLGSDAGKALRVALADEYMEHVIEVAPTACTAVCVGGRMAGKPRWRRFFSIRQGTIGVPPHGKCPVCMGPVEAEIAAGERP